MALDHLPNTIETEVLDNLRTVLNTDPHLTEQGVTLWLGEGDETQDDDPSLDEMPCVRLSLAGYQARRSTEKTHLGKLSVKFECFTAGRAINDQLRLANAVENALFPLDPTRSAEVKALIKDAAYSNGHVTGGEFTNQGSAPVVQGVTRYATRTNLILDVSVKKLTP